jgi:hypothetical protein
MEMKMNSTPEFEKFARRFIQDLELVCQTDDEALTFVLEDLDVPERKHLAGFIDQITSRQVSDFEIKKIWNNTESVISFTHAEDLRNMLNRVKNHLLNEQSALSR